MGIPLNMSIDAFQTRLAAKGIYPNREFNATSPFGTRMFAGRFTGRKCTFHVYYNNNKTVYRAKAVYANENESLADNYYSDIKSMLQEKYSLDNQEEDTYQGYPSFITYVTDDSGEMPLGTIGLYKTKFESYGMYLTTFMWTTLITLMAIGMIMKTRMTYNYF